MKYKVDGWNNFCRVFEIPAKFSSEFCFGGGIDTVFKMVDWFNPVSGLPQPTISKDVWEKEVGPFEVIEKTEQELHETVGRFVAGKEYVRKGFKYLILCNFGAALVIETRMEI